MASDSMRAVGSSGLGPGTVLDGKYEILTRIGAGGMGEVFKARHLHLNAFRCIKVMKQELLADDVFRSRFLREARLATQIHHPNIAVVHDFFVGESGSYMVVEFIDGRTVRQWAAAHGPFPLALAADLASQVLAGLDHIHRRGLLHRDISPDNVMLSFDADDRLTAKIIDLGIAKDVTNSVAADTTQVGVLIGNPKYMSPEQLGFLGDGEQVDGRADLYCLGVVLYEMLLGVPPFASETPHGYIMKHLTQAPRRFADVKPHLAIPDGIETVIFRALEKDRTKRYASAREFISALAPFLEAPAGMLTHEDVDRIRRGPETTEPNIPLPRFGHDHPTVADVPLPPNTEAKARAFELELLDQVYERESTNDREGLLRLAQAHPPGSEVGDAAREALARVQKTQEAEEAFQRAWEDGRSAAWREYLEHHASSPRAEEARRLAEEAAAFESATSTESETAVRQFLVAWPDARHHLEAGILLAKLKQRAAERRAYEDARAMSSLSGWRLYLTAYPNGAHADEARERIRASEKAAADAARAKEPADWETAWESGTSTAWDRYLADHPDSPRIDEARSCRQEAVDFEQATQLNSPAMWRAFIKTWPGGRHRMEAEIRLS
jgi:serine/threonine protein kinase/outer membrane protein assembly factor BamD (BamD/ComL family)